LTEVKAARACLAQVAVMMSMHSSEPPAGAGDEALRDAIARSFLAELGGTGIAAVLAEARLLRLPAETVLFRAGERPDSLLAVQDGSVSLFGRGAGGREASLEIVRPFEAVAPWAPLADTAHAVSARTVGRVTLLSLPAGALRAAVGVEPVLAARLLRRVCGQGAALLRQVEDLKLRSTVERVGGYLLALGATDGEPLALPYSKQLIASQLGMTPESLSRAFSALRAHGVSIFGNSVVVEDTGRLSAFCGLAP
jgi:CRP/FNR family transcriptional activator FtrB